MTETINGVPLELLKRAVQIPSKASVEENHAAIVDRGRAQAELRDMLNAAPVSEAKAQGVVMPTVDQAMRVVLREMSSKHIRGTSNWCADVGRAVLDEVASLNAAHVQHPDDDAVDRFAVAMKVKLAASREKGRHGWQNATGPHLSSLLHEHMFKGDPLDVGNLAMMLHQNGQAIELPHDARRVTAPVQQVSVPVSGVPSIKCWSCKQTVSLDDRADADGSCPHCCVELDLEEYLRTALAAAPAAPAADAGLSLIEWTKDAEDWGGALNDAGWVLIEQCPETSALLFNNTKGPLRAAIMKYAEIVAANRAKGVV